MRLLIFVFYDKIIKQYRATITDDIFALLFLNYRLNKVTIAWGQLSIPSYTITNKIFQLRVFLFSSTNHKFNFLKANLGTGKKENYAG